MRSRRVFPGVGEIEILRHKKSARRLSGGPDDMVIPPGDLFVQDRVDVVAEIVEETDELTRQVLVELDLHRLMGFSASGKSS